MKKKTIGLSKFLHFAPFFAPKFVFRPALLPTLLWPNQPWARTEHGAVEWDRAWCNSGPLLSTIEGVIPVIRCSDTERVEGVWPVLKPHCFRLPGTNTGHKVKAVRFAGCLSGLAGFIWCDTLRSNNTAADPVKYIFNEDSCIAWMTCQNIT